MENRIEFDGEKVWIDQEWYESLLEFRTKYITLTNFLLSKAELGIDGKLSIFTNVGDILSALEWFKASTLVKDLEERKAYKERQERQEAQEPAQKE